MSQDNDAGNNPKVPKKPPKKPRVINLILVSIRVTWLAVVFSLMLVVAGISWLVGSEDGTRWSLNTAQQYLPELTIDTPDGTLWRGIEAVSLRWQQDNMSIQIDTLKTKWRFDCLLELVLCIDDFSAGTIDIRLTKNDAEKPETKSSEALSLPDIALPVDLDLARLNIDSIRVDLGDGSDALLINKIELSTATQSNRLEFRRLSLAYQQYKASVTGSIELSGEYPLTLAIAATATPLLDNHNQKLDIRLSGSLQNLIIDGDTDGIAKAAFSASLKPLDKQLPYSAKVTWAKIAWPLKIQPSQVISRNGVLSAKGNLQTYAIKLTNSIEGEGIPATNIQLKGEGNLERFQLAELLVKTLGGQIDMNGKVDWRDGIRWATNINFDNIDPSVQWPDLPAALGGKIIANGLVKGEAISVTLEKLEVDGRILEYPLSLRVSAEHASDKTITLKELTLQIRENDAGVPKTSLAVSGEGDYSHFIASNIHIETLDGTVNGNAQVDWSDPAAPNRIKWLTELTLSDINPGQHWPEYPGQLSGSLFADGSSEGDAWTLSLKNADISGQLRQYPLTLNTKLNRSPDGQFTIDKLVLNSGDNQIQLTGSLSEEWSLDGDLVVNQPEALMPDISGKAKVEFELRGPREAPDVKLSANAKSLLFQDLAIDEVVIEAKIAALGESDSQLTTIAKGIKTSALALNEIDINLSGIRSDHQLALSTKGDINAELKLQGAIDAALNWLGTLASADIDAYRQLWSLQKPTAIGWQNENQSIDVAAHCWGQKAARVCLDEDTTMAKSGRAKLSIRDFSLASLQQYIPQHTNLGGIVTADGDIKWLAGKQPQANVKLKVLDGLVTLVGEGKAESLDLHYQSLTVNISAEESKVSADLLLDSNDIGNARADIIINPVADKKTISGNVSLDQLKLVTFKAFFPQLETLDGTFSANGNISGDLTAPRYTGSAGISGLNIVANDLPIAINDGFLRAQIDGAAAKIDAGWQSGGAPITLVGDADWQNLDSPVVNLVLDGENIEVRHAPTVVAKISPSIKLGISGSDINIRGKVDIPYARVTILELPPNATQISKDVVVIADQSLIDKKASAKDNNELRINTHIDVTLGKDVLIAGFGLRAELTGEIGIKQKPEGVVLLNGEVLIPNGIYKAYGQNLKIQRGRLLFVGPIDETAIDIDAARTVNSVTAGLKVRGSIKSPEVTLFSNPQQTQENTLSYIVLGKPIGSKSDGSDASLLAHAAVALGISGGRGIATSIAEQFGIQDFQIDTVGDGDDSQVQLSGRLSPNLILSYGVGVLTPVNTLKLRYNLTEQFYVETAQSVESALDFFYTFDF